MMTNHNHYAKKALSESLQADVEKWLESQGLKEPELLPMNARFENRHWNNAPKNAQSTMSKIMAKSIASTKPRKPRKPRAKAERPAVVYQPDLSESRVQFNRNARNLAWIAGEKHFIGKCFRHGEQKFSIRKDGKDHICQICSNEFSRVQNEKRKSAQVTA